MAFELDYQSVRDAVFDVLITNDKFVVANTATRYVRQIIKGRWIGGGPAPVVCIYVDGKQDETELGIGHIALVHVPVTIQVIDTMPARNVTTAMQTLLGLTELDTPEKVDNEIMAIAKEIETWFRGDLTDEGRARRRLNSPVQEYKIVRLPSTTLDNYTYQDGQSISEAMIQIVVEKRLINA